MKYFVALFILAAILGTLASIVDRIHSVVFFRSKAIRKRIHSIIIRERRILIEDSDKQIEDFKRECIAKNQKAYQEYLEARSIFEHKESEFRDRELLLNAKIKKLEEEQEKLKNTFRLELNTIEGNYKKTIDALNALLHSSTPFKDLAMVVRDDEYNFYSNAELHLENARRPALRAAEIVRELKERHSKTVFEYKLMEYKYNFLLSVFPELVPYTEDEQALSSLTQYDNVNEFDENRNRVRDWLTDEEYNALSELERNQLALDHYKNRNKSNWEIGIEYEMYVGYLFRRDEYCVEQYGETHGVEDLGRDLIVRKGNKIYIVQCKRWSQNTELHENVICQLFGTTLEYQIKNKNSLQPDTSVIPLICSTAPLSEMAGSFAERLGVVFRLLPMGEYPMIKCNIGRNGQKIYHLPFDQQYHNVRIDKPGEFYAWTVDEAESHGFRRAFRHFNH